jgi:hypothetical protein
MIAAAAKAKSALAMPMTMDPARPGASLIPPRRRCQGTEEGSEEGRSRKGVARGDNALSRAPVISDYRSAVTGSRQDSDGQPTVALSPISFSSWRRADGLL